MSVDLGAAEWRFTASKTGTPYIGPLSTQESNPWYKKAWPWITGTAVVVVWIFFERRKRYFKRRTFAICYLKHLCESLKLVPHRPNLDWHVDQ